MCEEQNESLTVSFHSRATKQRKQIFPKPRRDGEGAYVNGVDSRSEAGTRISRYNKVRPAQSSFLKLNSTSRLNTRTWTAQRHALYRY